MTIAVRKITSEPSSNMLSHTRRTASDAKQVANKVRNH
ncbi:unnamed protein product [Schistosoma mattheei]|uniref:Uncharacterized protein n=1 Tax=Schistosoma mattheei TaxID=31246 RepID=A0A183P493_9TREM|nr:unnamed protein product [Schistosoma mattheei]